MTPHFSLSSPQLKEGDRIAEEQLFNMYGCRGQNISPALDWHNPPEETESFAVILHDLDAPSGEFWHWVIFNIPADVTSLAKGAGDPQRHLAPAGSIQLRNGFGKPGYGGPCPPVGDTPHRYIFTVYALKVAILAADERATAARVIYDLQQALLGKAVLHASYAR